MLVLVGNIEAGGGGGGGGGGGAGAGAGDTAGFVATFFTVIDNIFRLLIEAACGAFVAATVLNE